MPNVAYRPSILGDPRAALPTGRPAAGQRPADRSAWTGVAGREAGGTGGSGEKRPPTENLNDFHNDFPPAGEAGGKKSKKYYYNNKTNNLLMMMMMMIFSRFPPKNIIILDTTKIL